MPSPSENKAIDLFLDAFPGSEIITPDNTHRLPKVEKEPLIPEDIKRPPPPKSIRRKRPKQKDSLFDE